MTLSFVLSIHVCPGLGSNDDDVLTVAHFPEILPVVTRQARRKRLNQGYGRGVICTTFCFSRLEKLGRVTTLILRSLNVLCFFGFAI